MKKPDDMVEVLKIISNQLQLLGIKNIRNVQTLILKERKGIYLNYEYFTAYKKGIIEEEEYNKHPTVHGIAMAMKKSAGAFFGGTMEKDELNVYREYRRQVNLFPDPLLDKATKPQYNFYSIGLGGLGLTTYEPLPPEGLEIFKRFHKVFSLVYSRFRDIEQAEAQVREAQIEAALERVRSRSMAMNHTSELQEVIITVHQQFKHLGIVDSGGSFIAINNEIDDGGNLCCWGASGMVDYLQQIQIPLLERPIMANLVQKIKNGPGFFTEKFTYEDKMEFFAHMFKFPPLNSSAPNHKKEVFSREGGYTRSCLVSKYTSIFSSIIMVISFPMRIMKS